MDFIIAMVTGFNTQPPEGGWNIFHYGGFLTAGFNTQPPEGGWSGQLQGIKGVFVFQHTAA